MSISGSLLETVQAVVALGLIALALWCLPLALATAWRVFRPAASAVGSSAREAGWVVLGATGAAAAARLLAPHLLATIFIGYKLTEQAASLFPVSHYGVGASALYHAVFGALPVDHAVVMGVNAGLGVLLVPLAAAWTARLFDDRRAGAIAAVLLALTPLFIRNDASEANNVPSLLWLFGGLVLWQEHLERGRRLPLAAAVPLLALCSVSRPEMSLLVAACVLATLWAHRLGPGHWDLGWKLAAGVALVALAVPHLLHVSNAMDTLRGQASLPGMELSELSLLPRWFVTRNVVLRPSLFPVLTSASVVAALVLRGTRGRSVDWAVFAVLLLAVFVYIVDLDEANIARVHVPAAGLATVLGAAGISRLAGRLGRNKAWLAPLLCVAVVGSAVPSVATLWQPTNEATEEGLIRETQVALADDEVFTLIRPHSADRRRRKTSGFTHFHFPDYLFRPPARDGVVRSMRAFLDSPGDLEDEPVYFLHGMRCYADFRVRGTPPPAGDDLHPSCRAMHERFVLEPVFEREVANYGDVWIAYYGDAETLRVGLYRVRSAR